MSKNYVSYTLQSGGGRDDEVINLNTICAFDSVRNNHRHSLP